jgi:hypothetical protein
MKYKDDNGKVYEISYSQKLQREQNRLLRQKNRIMVALLLLVGLFGLGVAYAYLRLDAIDFLTNLDRAVDVLATLR